jgi:MFS family permease
MKTNPSSKRAFFYGYWVLLSAFAGVFIFAGIGLYSFSFFIKPLQASLGWDRGAIMLGNTLWFLSMGLASPVVGRLVDRHGVKRVIATGTVMVSAGLALLSIMQSLWLYCISWVIVGAGMAAIAQVPASAVVSHWFVKRRGLAIGVMSAAVGVGGIVFSPVVGGFLIPTLGWRSAFLTLGIFTSLLLLPLALFVIRTKPGDKGLYPDGMSAEEYARMPKATSSASGGLTLKKALATPAFWLIAACYMIHMLPQHGMMQTNVPHITDIGFSAATAATLMSVLGMMSAFGKFAFGWICDWIKAKYALAIGLVMQLAAIAVMSTITLESPTALIWVFAVLMGLGIGSWLPTMSIIVSYNFGLVAYGAIFGIISLLNNIGGSIGPVTAGLIYDFTGSYSLAFKIFLVLFAISIPLILLVKRPAALDEKS